MCSERRLTANRLTTLKMRLRLDMGRYDLMSSGSRDGFLILGRTIACLCDEGKIPCSNNAFAVGDDRRENVAHRFNQHRRYRIKITLLTRIGFNHRIRVTSSTDTTPKPSKCGTSLWATLGAGADAVATRIAATLLVKELLKSLAECGVDVDVSRLNKKVHLFPERF